MKMKKTILLSIVSLLIVAVIFALIPRRYESVFFPMGPIPFKIVCYDKNYVGFDRVMGAVETRVLDLVEVFSSHKLSSELSQLNATAANRPFAASHDMLELLVMSRKWYALTSGAFDPSVAPLVAIWARAGKKGTLPAAAMLEEVKKLVGMDMVGVTPDGGVYFALKGMALDFGGLAKGYIVDLAAKVMREKGVSKGVVDAGGDIYAFGDGPFKFGIQDPFDSEAIIGSIEVGEGAIVTSGDYERFVEIDGKKYSHIIDPKKGVPSESGVISATVVGGDAANADALATSIVVMGLQKGIELIKKAQGVEAIIVVGSKDDYEVHFSKSLKLGLELLPQWQGNSKMF
jgi:thiamine biosynthesis lipoprotein